MTRIDRINAYGDHLKQIAIDKENEKKKKFLSYKLYVNSIADRISILIDTAIACQNNHISLANFDIANTDGLRIREINPYYSSAVNEKSSWFLCYINPKDPDQQTYFSSSGEIYTWGPSTTKKGYCLTQPTELSDYYKICNFAEDFDAFESKFYAYVDSIC